MTETGIGTGELKEEQDFSWALSKLKLGHKVFRTAWDKERLETWVALQEGYPKGIAINANTAKATGLPEGTMCVFQPYLMRKSSDNSFVGWVPDQTDLLANDWHTVTRLTDTTQKVA